MEKARIKFLEENLHNPVIVDMSRYFNSAIGVNCDKTVIPGFLNGINKSDTQQFDIDFNLGEWGFEYYNCFHDTCRLYSHTSHAEHISVVKRTVDDMTDNELELLSFIQNWRRGFSQNNDASAQYDIKNLIKIFIKGELGMNFELYETLKSMNILIPYFHIENNKPFTKSIEELLELKWVKIKE